MRLFFSSRRVVHEWILCECSCSRGWPAFSDFAVTVTLMGCPFVLARRKLTRSSLLLEFAMSWV